METQKKKIIKFKRDAMITIRIIRPPCTASTASRTTSRIASHFILIGITKYSKTFISGYVSAYARKIDKLI